MSDPSYRLKLDRSIGHLHELHAAHDRWAQRDPCVIRQECEIETRKHRAFVEIVVEPSDPLIPLCVADCIHNMRQALDHLAYQLAVSLYGADPPPNADNTGFPITSNITHFRNAVYGKVAAKKHMPKTLYAALEAIQPHPGQDQTLWTLHELDNLDKHRTPPLVVGIAEGQGFHIGTFTGSHFVGPRLGTLEPNTPVIEYIPAPDTDVSMNLAFAPQVALSQTSDVAPGTPILPLLYSIQNFIRVQVLPRVEPFL